VQAVSHETRTVAQVEASISEFWHHDLFGEFDLVIVIGEDVLLAWCGRNREGQREENREAENEIYVKVINRNFKSSMYWVQLCVRLIG
jgi:hypothetical protein